MQPDPQSREAVPLLALVGYGLAAAGAAVSSTVLLGMLTYPVWHPVVAYLVGVAATGAVVFVFAASARPVLTRLFDADYPDPSPMRRVSAAVAAGMLAAIFVPVVIIVRLRHGDVRQEVSGVVRGLRVAYREALSSPKGDRDAA